MTERVGNESPATPKRISSLAISTVSALLRKLGGQDSPADSLCSAQESLVALRDKLGGGEKAASVLGTDISTFDRFTKALRQACNYESQETVAAQRNRPIAYLRLIHSVQAVLSREVSADTDRDGTTDATLSQKKVRGIELVIRRLIEEAYGTQASLSAHLKEVLNREIYDRWMKSADPGDILSGSMFAELATFFVDKNEFAKHYDRIFSEPELLSYLRGKSKTAGLYLEDIRFIRNRLAHHKKIDWTHVALLDLYYEELIKPIQQYHDYGQTAVNPDKIADVTTIELDAHFAKVGQKIDSLGGELENIGDNLSDLNASVEQVQRNVQSNIRETGVVRRHTTALLVGVAALIVAAVFIFRKADVTLANTEDLKAGVRQVDSKLATVKQETSADPRKELANRGISWTSGSFAEAFKQHDLESLRLFLAGGMQWNLVQASMAFQDRDDVALGELLIEHSENLKPGGDDCRYFMSKAVRPDNEEFRKTGKTKLKALGPEERKFLRRFCSRSEDVEWAKAELARRQKNLKESIAAYNDEKAHMRNPSTCEREELANNASALLRDASESSMSRMTISGREKLLAFIKIPMMTGTLDSGKLRQLVHEYCVEQASTLPNIDIDDWLVRGYQVVLDSIA